MATIGEIRTALAAQLQEHLPAGVRVHAVLPTQVNPPAVVVRRQLTTFDTTQGGQSNDPTLAVVVFVQFAATTQAQDNLDAFLAPTGDSSVYAAVNADPTFGGVVDWAVVTEAGPDEVLQYQGVDYLTGTLLVQVG